MERRSVIPLHNLTKVPFDLPSLALSRSTSIAPVESGDYSALHFGAESIYRPIVGPNTLCIMTDDPPRADFPLFARLTAMKVCFVLNSCASGPPLIMSKCALLQKTPSTEYLETADISAFHKTTQHADATFALKAEITPADIEKLYDIFSGVLDAHEEVHVTIDRFNYSLYRVEPTDQIIDITTSLESLIQSQTEIAFKFALYISFIVEGEPSRRKQLFKTMQDLYSVRSAIVHGDIHQTKRKQTIQAIVARMAEIRRIAHSAISYYVFYLSDRRELSWHDHLEQLLLGTATRIQT